MVKELSTTQMEINIRVSLLMDCLKDLANILGPIAPIIKEISSRAIETDMEYGPIALIKETKPIQDTICLIKSMDMGYTTGETGTTTREAL